MGMAYANFFLGNYEEALKHAAVALRDQPNHLGTLRLAMASHALSGNIEAAQSRLLCSLHLIACPRRESGHRGEIKTFRSYRKAFASPDALGVLACLETNPDQYTEVRADGRRSAFRQFALGKFGIRPKRGPHLDVRPPCRWRTPRCDAMLDHRRCQNTSRLRPSIRAIGRLRLTQLTPLAPAYQDTPVETAGTGATLGRPD